jgi:predicted N-acetyltransferase YhbS
MTVMTIQYREGNDLDLDQVVELYRASSLGERRPVDDRDTMRDMLAHGNLTITAWDDERMIGISRSLTDFSYVAYLSDLAVHVDYQGRGIGTRLIAETRARMGPKSTVVLFSAPAAVDYYPRVGFAHHPQGWVLPAKDELRGAATDG